MQTGHGPLPLHFGQWDLGIRSQGRLRWESPPHPALSALDSELGSRTCVLSGRGPKEGPCGSPSAAPDRPRGLLPASTAGSERLHQLATGCHQAN